MNTVPAGPVAGRAWQAARALLVAGLLLAGSSRAADCLQAAMVCEVAVAGALPLVKAGQPAAILADAGDFPGVLRAVRDLQVDLGKVAGSPAQLSLAAPVPGTAIIVGTLGRSARVDRIVREQGIDTGGVAGRWEAYLMQVVEHPEPGIERALLIAGADKRGSIFGVYELSRRLGVSPWQWWADVPVPQRRNLQVAAGRHVDAPVVKYRGIFLNDEDPALGGWMQARFGGPNHAFYEHVFTLLLRLKGNYLWPAMWGRAFADDDPLNPALADEYGVVIGTTHHEPMMRAHVEWQRHGSGPWDYTKNAATLRDFWRKGIARMGDHESVVTLGMRGDGDEAMGQDTAIPLLERIVADQRRIIGEVTARPVEQTPQVWALYKEVQDYFDQGMQVPDDVTLLFADDNWGNLRRLPKRDEQRAGGYGIYYHFDYVGGPRNYKWINTTQIERVWEQMGLAHAWGADRLWISNVGDLKPMEMPISFFLDYAWNPDALQLPQLQAWPQQWAAEQFGEAHAAEIGQLLSCYTRYNARRKPELLDAQTWSLVNYHEAERVMQQWDALVERARRVAAELDPRWHDAYQELVQYPIEASANLNALHVAVARNHLYARQGRASANAWADTAERLFARDAELARAYEQDIAGGKWLHMMAQPRIGYTHWQQPSRNVLPALSRVDVVDAGVMGVAVEGDARAWPQPDARARLPLLESFAATSREVEVFNRGGAPFTFQAQALQPWLRVSPDHGDVVDARRLQLQVDWEQVPAGAHEAVLYLRGSDGTEVHLDVPVLRKDAAAMHGFIESDGVVAIEAEHAARRVDADGVHWTTIPGLGRTRSALVALPADAAQSVPGGTGARLEYPLWLQADGDVDVRVSVSPSLDFRGGDGLRFALSLDDQAPQVLTLALDPTPGHADFQAWSKAVVDSVHVAVSRQRATAGAHTLKLWRIDPGVAFQRIEVVRGSIRDSYLGAPESRRQ